MDDVSQKLSRSLWFGLGLLIIVICLAYATSRPKARLPVLTQVNDFVLTNQNNQPVTLRDLRGNVWVADIIFTRCAGPCPRMTRQMKSLQDALPGTSAARLVTLTTDPDFDTPPVLRIYGERAGANTNRWMLLTGSKKEIAGLAIESLKLAAMEKNPREQENPNDLFIHSTYFVVVDRQARLRGVFETTGPDIEWTNVQRQIVATVRQLEREK